jgi:hypothetical protein
MRAKVAFLVSATFAPAAHAGFFVTDAAPPVAVRSVSQPVASDSSATYKVPFNARSSQISWAARRSLGAILTSLEDATKITISGCGDTKGGDALAYRRGAAIKGWMIENGIGQDVVNVATDTDSSVMRSGKVFDCAITASRQTTPYQQLFGGNGPTPVPASYSAVAADVQPVLRSQAIPAPIAPSATGDAQLAMIRQVLDMVKGKIVKPEDAVAMLQAIIKSGGPEPALPQPQAAPPSMPPIYASAAVQATAQPRMQYVSARVPVARVIAPTIAYAPSIAVEPVVQTWAFGDNQTLKDTLTAWARDAGWNPPDWRASNPYRVSGAPVTGSFFDALRAICAAAPALDIKADAQRRELIVTDAGK